MEARTRANSREEELKKLGRSLSRAQFEITEYRRVQEKVKVSNTCPLFFCPFYMPIPCVTVKRK